MSIYSLNLHALSTQQLEELECMIQEQLDVRARLGRRTARRI